MPTTLYEQARHDPTIPLGARLALTATFNGLLVALVWTARRKGRLPQTVGWGDMALVGLASYKVARLVAKDRVTLPIRAPFIDAERQEPIGSGLRRAMGELLTCPFCLAPWAALGLDTGLVLAPRATRFACSVLGTSVLAGPAASGPALPAG